MSEIRTLGLASTLLSACLLLLKAFHGQKELFKSEHYDWCFASTIESKCRVHSLHTYQVCVAHFPTWMLDPRLLWKPVRACQGLEDAHAICLYRSDMHLHCLQALQNVGAGDFFARFTYRVSLDHHGALLQIAHSLLL